MWTFYRRQAMDTDEKYKLEEYFKTIEGYVIDFIKRACLNESCIGTLLLLFAALDGLGKLLHPNSDAQVNERFKYMISKFGSAYAKKKEKIWELRNSLAHNALNVEVFLSMTEIGKEHHLEDVHAPGNIYINTKVFFDDFLNFYYSEKARIMKNPSALSQAASRLVWGYDDEKYSLNYPTTPPAPVEFVLTR